MKKEILITKNLTKSYGKFKALEELNLKVDGPSCVGLLGPNGAGKTTTIKIFSGLIHPTSGTVLIDGLDISRDPRSVRSKIGFVVETPEFYPSLSPNELLSYFGQIRGIPKERLNENVGKTLRLVRLEKWAAKRVGKFSKGMKQRLALASALLHDPPILILDEPTTGLDPRGAKEIREIITTLKKSGKTIFMSSHILGEVQSICDDVALLDNGRLVRYEKISSLETGETIIEINSLNQVTDDHVKRIQEIEGVVSSKREGKTNLFISFKGDLQDRANLLKRIQSIGLVVISFTTKTVDLESLYMDQISESVR